MLCPDKKRFKSPLEVHKEVQLMRQKNQIVHSYYCKHCGGYHMTTVEPHFYRIIKKIQANDKVPIPAGIHRAHIMHRGLPQQTDVGAVHNHSGQKHIPRGKRAR